MIYLAFGLLAGTFSGLFGIGGGVILVPLFISILSYTPHQAVSLSLMAMSLPVFAISLWKHYQVGHWSFDMIKWGVLVALGMLFGGLFGATISSKLSSLLLKRSFAVLLVLVAVKLWFEKK